MKKSFPVLKSGSVEDHLKWTNDMWYIVKNKSCKSPASKFDTIKCLFVEEALEEWETCKATVTNKVVLVPIDFPDEPEDKIVSAD